MRAAAGLNALTIIGAPSRLRLPGALVIDAARTACMMHPHQLCALEQAEPLRLEHCGEPRAAAEPRENRLHVISRRRLRADETAGDLTRRQAFAEQAKNLVLARR